VKDEGKAFEAIAKFVDNLVEAGVEKAKALEELKVENMALDAYLTFAVDLLQRAKERLMEYERFTDLVARTVCPSSIHFV
jgi:TATA-box binding protein (TBP) (component of TFIID and TFIIIB)